MTCTIFDPDERLARLILCRSEGIGARGFGRLVHRHGGSARRVLAEWAGLPPDIVRRVRLCTEQTALAELAAIERHGARLLFLGEPDYPEALAAIHDPPPVLTVLGRTELLDQPMVAIVGSRQASGNGRKLAQLLAHELAEAGIVVVSGLARGIDAAAHEGALAGSAGTVAVIGTGIDQVYPEANEALSAEIVQRGLVTTERPFGALPKAAAFPARNRIISGLSLGILVVEAALQSGSLVTARLALEQGREVMAVPGSPMDERHRGTNRLIKDGAQLIETSQDVLAVVEPLIRRSLVRSRPVGPVRARPLQPAAATPMLGGLEPASDGLTGRLLACLGHEPLAVDDLVRQCQATTAQVQEALLELELEGRLERHGGNRVSLLVA